MSKIDILLELNKLEYDILALAYITDDDGLDENEKPMIRKVYKGLDEKELKSLLVKITDIIQLIKESE